MAVGIEGRGFLRVRIAWVIDSGSLKCRNHFPRLAKKRMTFLIICRDEDARVATLGTDLIFRHQLDLHSIPQAILPCRWPDD